MLGPGNSTNSLCNRRYWRRLTDPTRFDTISKLFASRRTRRSAVAGGIALATTGIGASAFAQDATPAAKDTTHPNAATRNITELFAQAFDGGTWEPAGNDGTYTLTLSGAAAQTIYFADRPERFFGLVPMDQFIAALDSEPTDPPNAALVTQDPDSGDEDILLVELANPQYDASTSTLTYDATILTDYQQSGLSSAAIRQQDYDFPASFSQGGLFIDGFCSGEYDVKCTLKSDGSVIGSSNNNGCCWRGWGCHQCHHVDDDCADTYPKQCRDADGNNLCTGQTIAGNCN